MESAEAILENENNSNVESESYIRQQQQLSLQNTAAAQGEPSGEKALEASGLSESHADLGVAKNSHEDTEIQASGNVTEEKEELEKFETDNHKEESNFPGVNCAGDNQISGSLEDNGVVDGGDESMNVDDDNMTAQMQGDGHSGDTDATENDESNDHQEAVDEGDVAMQDPDSELNNEDDMGSSEKVMSKENVESSNVTKERMERDREEESSSPQLDNPSENNSNSEPPDLHQESAGGSETLLQFSPLGDNDLVPSPKNVEESQSCSSDVESHSVAFSDEKVNDDLDIPEASDGKVNDDIDILGAPEDEKEVTQGEESRMDDEILNEGDDENNRRSAEKEASDGKVNDDIDIPGALEDENEVTQGEESRMDDEILNEGDDENNGSSADKEIESNLEEQTAVATKTLTVSQEEENELLSEETTDSELLDGKNADMETAKESTGEVGEKGDDDSSDAVTISEQIESEMEVTSKVSDENSKGLNADEEESVQSEQCKDNNAESEMEVESSAGEVNLIDNGNDQNVTEPTESSLQEKSLELNENESQSNISEQSESEAAEKHENVEAESQPVVSEEVKEVDEPTAAIDTAPEGENMDTSEGVTENVDDAGKAVDSGVEETPVEKSAETVENMEIASEGVENLETSDKNIEENVDAVQVASSKKSSDNAEKANLASSSNEEASPESTEKENIEVKNVEAPISTEKENIEADNAEASPKSTEKENVEASTDSVPSESSINVSQTDGNNTEDQNTVNGPESENSNSAEVSTAGKSASSTDIEMVDENNVDSAPSKGVEKEPVVSEVIPAADIKKEVTESHTAVSETPSLPVSSKELKKEIMNDDDDIVILDEEEEQEPVRVKKEAVEGKSKDASNSGIQIAAVSGQEDKLHSHIHGALKDSDYKAEKSSKSKTQKCIVCQKVTKCKFNIVRGGDTKQLCDDVCFKKFRKSPTMFLSKPMAAEQPQAKLASIKPKPSDMLVVNLGETMSVSGTTTAPALTSLLTTCNQSLEQLQQTKQQKPQQQQQSYKTCSVCQVMNVQSSQSFCNWKGFDFCGEICLGKFQSTLRAHCSNCLAFIPNDMRASYCTKIGNTMHPFCKQMCVADFLKKLKTCVCCKRDISKLASVIARVGADDRPKEFCSQACVKEFQDQVEDVEIVHVEPGQGSASSSCSVCTSTVNAIKHTVRFHSKTFKLCSDLCLSAFQYTNKINLNKCSTCGNMCTQAQSQPFFIQFEGETKRFCSDRCISTFRLDNRKLAACSWCAARKVNFDMIERQDENNKYQLFCSLNCLSLFRVNLQAKSNQAVECDRCRKIVPAQYHLTMSDASVRNFCSYACVMGFQSQFTARIAPPLPLLAGTVTTSPAAPVTQQKKVVQTSTIPTVAQPPTPPVPASAPHPHGTRNRGRRTTKGLPKAPLTTASTSTSTTSIPVISSVMSLATEDVPPDAPTGLELQEKAVAALLKNLEKKGSLVTGDGKQRVVVEAPVPKMMKNKALQCKPMCQTKATACRPHSQHKECQTDENMGKPVLIPIPVPIYIPMPTVMYQAPAPVPVPFPIPIPVPIFVPTTRKSANGIIKCIKEIQERMPADPLEAEILMMAEAVATDKKTAGDSDSDSDMEGDTGFDAPADDGDAGKIDVPEKEGERRTEDMIQMALRMAEEMTGPMEDLETSVQPVAVNAISGHSVQVAKQEQHALMANNNYQQQVEEDPDYMPMKSGRGRGSKRASRGRPPMNSRAKRQRTGRGYADQEMEREQETPPPPRVEVVVPPPDTNYRLKFTYGVNAWKHWVVTKNAELESASKTNPKVRLLPLDVLQCTMDQLHFSLCLFIKEVRKPNGDSYSPDSIYYLCLGIQQYLYENGRIDNLFTDLYFQRFTDSLHEVLKALQPKVNSQGQMLCRIEEEHLWESKQLGAHSPYVLLNTLIYFHTKHFILKTAADHMSLSFAQILKHWKKGIPLKGNAAPKNASLRFYCLANNKKTDSRKGKEGGVPVYEVTENFDNPLRCPVKLYEFFLSKCPESIKNRNDIFYPVPERSCVPDSPVWYSTQSIEHHTMDKMLTRILLVREIQESHLHAQPTYIKM